VAVRLADKGLFVFTACSHAGLINVLTDAQAQFPDIPLYGVLVQVQATFFRLAGCFLGGSVCRRRSCRSQP